MERREKPPKLLRAKVREIRVAGERGEHRGVAQIGGTRVRRARGEMRGERRQVRRIGRGDDGRREVGGRRLAHLDRAVAYAGGR